jgi:hypothetical protein
MNDEATTFARPTFEEYVASQGYDEDELIRREDDNTWDDLYAAWEQEHQAEEQSQPPAAERQTPRLRGIEGEIKAAQAELDRIREEIAAVGKPDPLRPRGEGDALDVKVRRPGPSNSSLPRPRLPRHSSGWTTPHSLPRKMS